MAKDTYCNDTYRMYEEEVYKNEKLEKENKEKDLEIYLLKREIELLKNNMQSKINEAVEIATKPLLEKITNLESELNLYKNDNDRLKEQTEKNSTNSSKPSSTDNVTPKEKSPNEYNYRTKTSKKTGGQLWHEPHYLSKNTVEKLIEDKKVKVKKITHYIYGNNNEEDIIKYVVDMNVVTVIEKHIFKHIQKSKDILPRCFYSDVTYSDNIKSLIIHLSAYNIIPYKRTTELISVLSNDIVNISQGTINNFYKDFSISSKPSLHNIENATLNSDKMHVDDTTCKYCKKNIYFKGYGNQLNVLYKVHLHKGHKSILEDNILPRYTGCIIGDHDTSLYSHGTSHQECNIHTGRYLEAVNQTCIETYWQQEMKEFLFTVERTRKIAKSFGKKEFTQDEIERYFKIYDDILDKADKEIEEVKSGYYKKKAKTLIKRLKKYKESHLHFIKDFNIPFDNNLMERDLRMIKNKTKISGGFRSLESAEYFGDIMSIVKTSIKREINPMKSIKDIFAGKVLFEN